MNPARAFRPANPHAMSAIVRASERHTIVAAEDIVDERGVKLWARDQPVSHALQQRLFERRLREPIESCLRAVDGVGTPALERAMREWLEGGEPLAAAVVPHAQALFAELAQLPIHPAAQLMLTTLQSDRPQAFSHAVQAMALAGATLQARGASRYEVRVALLAGLLHDIGELYLDPVLLDSAQALDDAGWRHVAVHPVLGATLLRESTDYPPAIARAIGEHHERLDGTGYPARSLSSSLSSLGRLLAVVEAVLGCAQSEGPLPLLRASFALRAVPREFEEEWTGFFSHAARRVESNTAPPETPPAAELAEGLEDIGRRLEAARADLQRIHECEPSAALSSTTARALHMIERLRVGWNAMGLWCPGVDSASVRDRQELVLAKMELSRRLHHLRRECEWRDGDLLSEQERAMLAPVWSILA